MSAEQDLANANVKISELVVEVQRFRDAVMGISSVYPTITEGRQNTADGKYFSVPGAGAYMRLYRRSGSSSSLIAEFPDRIAVEQIAKAGWGTDDLQTVTTTAADALTISGVYAVSPASGSGWPFAAASILMVMGRSGGFATHFLMRQASNGGDTLHIRQISAGNTTAWKRVWTSQNFEIQSGTRDLGEGNTAPTLMQVGAFGIGGVVSPVIFPNPEENLIPTGVYRDANTTAFNPPSRATILAMQGFSGSQVFLAIERNNGQLSTFAQNANGTTSARWVVSYDRDNANQPVSFNESLGRPSGGIVEAGGSRDDGWYIKFLDGTLVCGIHRASLTYTTANVLRYRFNFPTTVRQTLAMIATPIDPYNFNGTQYNTTFLAAHLKPIVQRLRSTSYANFQIACPTPSDTWIQGDELKCDIVIWGRWRGALDESDPSGGSN